MKRKAFFTAPLTLTIILLLTFFLWNNPFTGLAKPPAAMPVRVADQNPQASDSANLAIKSGEVDSVSGSCQALNSTACSILPQNWVIKTPLPAAVIGVAAASDGQYVYAAGGYRETAVHSFSRYDPFTDQWTVLNPLPVTIRNALAVYAQGRIYIIGGETSDGVVGSVYIYNIATGLWSNGAAMPGVRQQMGGGYDNGRIFVAGGVDSPGITPQNQTWEYSIAANSWSIKASLPVSLASPGSGIINGDLYLAGGRDAGQYALKTTYKYHIATNSWSRAADLLAPVNYPGSAILNNRLWLFGGGVPFLASDGLAPQIASTVADTQVYDPATDTWQYGPTQNIARSFQAGAVVFNQMISIAGFASTTASNTVEVLTQERLKILIIFADAHTIPNKLRFALMQQPEVSKVDLLDGEVIVPTLAQMENYNIVIPISSAKFSSPTSLGNNLADYQDGGGIVVGFAYDWLAGLTIEGRWQSEGYSPFNPTSVSISQTASLGAYNSSHPLMKKIVSLSAHDRLQLTVAGGAVQVAAWNDGQPLIAAKGRAVGVNAFLGDRSNNNWSGDFARVVVNAGNWQWLGNASCNALVCPGPTIIHGAISDTDPTQTGRLYKSEPPATCALPRTCAIQNGDNGVRHYDAYRFVNNNISQQCVTVSIDAGSCTGAGHWIQSSAYLGSYDPANLCLNYLADSGGSPNPVKTFSFSVPAWQFYTVIVNENDPNTFCAGYNLKVSPGRCPIQEIFTPRIQSISP